MFIIDYFHMKNQWKICIQSSSLKVNLIWNNFVLHKNDKSVDSSHIPIWFNNNILISNKTVFYKHWAAKNIYFITDIIKDNNNFYTFQEFQDFFGINSNFLEYHGLVIAIKRYLEKNNISVEKTTSFQEWQVCYVKVKRDVKICTKS